MKHVIVVGGGIAGLTCAWTLQRAGVKTLLIEAARQPGGNLATTRESGFVLEAGPHSFMSYSDAVWKIVEQAGLTDRVIAANPESAKRYVYRDGQLNLLPMGLGSFLTTGILSWKGKLRLMIEPFVKGRPEEEETAAAFFTRRLGPEAVRWLIGPFVSGVYAGDPACLGARDAFAKMTAWEEEAGSLVKGARLYMRRKRQERSEEARKRKGMYSFDEGLRVLPDRLASDLGTHLHLGETVHALEKIAGGWRVHSDIAQYESQIVVLAVPPPQAHRMLGLYHADLAARFDAIQMAPVAVVHLGLDEATSRALPSSFGFLVPRGEGFRILGCIFLSKIYPGRADGEKGLLLCYYGGVFDPDALTLSSPEIERLCRDELARLLNLEPGVIFSKVVRHPKAIPQLTVGHRRRVRELLDDVNAVGGLALAGNYLQGVGMNEAAESGFIAAEDILAQMGLSQE